MQTKTNCNANRYANELTMATAQPTIGSDIRRYMLPHATDHLQILTPVITGNNSAITQQPPRRRRIIHDTDSSDDEPLIGRRSLAAAGATEIIAAGPQVQPKIVPSSGGQRMMMTAGAADGAVVIVIDDVDDHHSQINTVTQTTHFTSTGVVAADDDDGNDGENGPSPTTPAIMNVMSGEHSRGGARSHRPAQRQLPCSRSRRRFEAEAREVDDESDSQSADESDEDAVDLYRSVMAGMRNRPAALQRVRTDTIPCSNCKRFAKFLESFL